MKVYVVEYYDYDDFSIDGIFSTQEKAEEWLTKREKPTILKDGFKYWMRHQIGEYEVDSEV